MKRNVEILFDFSLRTILNTYAVALSKCVFYLTYYGFLQQLPQLQKLKYTHTEKVHKLINKLSQE